MRGPIKLTPLRSVALTMTLGITLLLALFTTIVQVKSNKANLIQHNSIEFSPGKYLIESVNWAQSRQDTIVPDWYELALSNKPSPRAAYAMTYDEFQHKLLFFGGVCSPTDGGSCNDTWEYSATNGWQRLSPTTVPPRRSSATLVHDTVRNKFVLFGGHVCCVYMNDTWEFDGTNWTQSTVANPPLTRGSHAATYDPVRGKMIIFGGWRNTQTGDDILNDTWEYDGSKWTRIFTADTPLCRTGAQMVYAPELGGVILFGGVGCGHLHNDMWVFDGSNWTEISTATKPEGRYYHAMAYDWNREAIVLFGGYNAGERRAMTDTWEYDGTDWYPITPTVSPPGTWAATAIYYPPQAGVILFGGNSPLQNNLKDYTYLYQLDGIKTYTATGKIVDDYDNPASNVSISYKDNRHVNTDQSGIYTIPYLAAGIYTITPNSIQESIFSPLIRTVDLDQSITNINFFRRPEAAPFLIHPLSSTLTIAKVFKPSGETGALSSLFDHEIPTYALDGYLLPWHGMKKSDVRNVLCTWGDNCYDGHSGIDLDDNLDTSAYAAATGTITKIQSLDQGGYGKYIVVNHRNGYATLYGHLKDIDSAIHEEQPVFAGQRLGTIGTTGNSTGTHLHFGVYFDSDGDGTWSVIDTSERMTEKEAVDPFGWCDQDVDPWTRSGGWKSKNLWVNYDGCTRTTLTESASQVASASGDIVATTPDFAVDSPVTVSILESPPIESIQTLPESKRVIGQSFWLLVQEWLQDQQAAMSRNVIDIKQSNGVSNAQQFNLPITLTVRYSDELLQHYDPATISIAHWDEDVNDWQIIPEIAQESNEISFRTQRVGNYLLVGNLMCPVEQTEPNDLDLLAEDLAVNTESGIHVFDQVNDVDWFRISLDSGTKYEFHFTSVADRTVPVLEIFATDGATFLHSGTDIWMPEESSTYYLKVSDVAGMAYGCDASYKIQVSEWSSPTLTPTPSPTPLVTPVPTTSPTATPTEFATLTPTPTTTPIPTKPIPTATLSDSFLMTPQLIAPEDNITIEEGSKLTYQWQSVADADSYEILQLLNPDSDLPNSNRVTVTGMTYTDEADLTPGHYSWEVKAKTSTGLASAANRRYFSVAPHNPTNLQVTATGCQTVTLTWDDNSAYETAYHVYRNGTKISEQPALNGGSGAFQDTNLNQNTTYEYKVIAYHSAANLAGVTISVTTQCPDGTFTVEFEKQGNGTITVNKPGPYPSGTQVQLTAIPDSGWHFVRWESTELLGDQVNQPTITITVSKDITYTAHFEPDVPPSTNSIYLPLITR